MTRHYGRAVRGQRVHDAVPKNFGRNITILGALSWYGLDAVMTVEGATDAEVFRAYVSRVLAPTLRPGDVVVMDNLSSHKVAGIDNAITSTGAKLIYLPPYSPDWSPIDPSNPAGRRSKPGCAASRHAHVQHWTVPSRRSSTPSAIATPEVGSPTAAMPSTNLKSALVLLRH
jgi:hypothetical protein